jgi:hypothetical protein
VNKLWICGVLALSLSACSSVVEKQGQDGHRYLATSATTITDCNLMLDTYAGHHVQLARVRDNDMLITGGLMNSERNRYTCAARAD